MAAIPHRVLVGGMRGKSTLTRLLHTGFRAAGHEALGRVTGDAPMMIMRDGSEQPQHRRGPANIRELRRLAFSNQIEGVDALIVENMAIAPELQRVIASRIIIPTVQALAVDAPDHLDVFSPDPAGRAREVVATLDPAVPVVIAESPRNATVIAAIQERGIQARVATPSDREGVRPHMMPLVAVAEAVLRHCGLHSDAIAKAIAARARDLQRIAVYRVGGMVAYDLLSANDCESTAALVEQIAGQSRGDCLYVYNHRRDRSERLESFRHLLSGAELRIVGEAPPSWWRRRTGVVYTPRWEPSGDGPPRTAFLVGNTGGYGAMLRDDLRRRAEVSSW